MARKLIEYKISDTDTVSYSNYNSSKTVLGPMINKFTGSSLSDYYIGPPSMGWRNITQDTGYSYFGIPTVVNYTDETDLVFMTYFYGNVSTLRIIGYSFNKKTGNYTYLGMINAPTHNGSAAFLSAPVVTLDFYTAGTVSVSGDTVLGINTFWGDNQIKAGSRIGFGSTNSKDITNWYEIKSVPLETARLNNAVWALEVDSLGRVYAGGAFTTYNFLGSAYTATRIIRLNSDGSPDLTFRTGTGFNGNVRRIKIDPTDSSKVYVAGDFTTYSGVSVGYITKLNVSDGSIDSNWDLRNMPGVTLGFNNNVYDIDFDSQGRVFATGLFTSYVRSGTTVTTTRLCRLLPNGNLDTSFSGYTTGLVWSTTPGSTQPYSIAVDKPTDKVYVGGQLNSWNGYNVGNQFNIMRINTNGTVDSTFSITGGTYFNAHPYSITYDTFNGGIYVGGAFTTWSGSTNNYIIKLTSGGTKDNSFNNTILSSFNGLVNKIRITNDNKLIVSGAFTTYRTVGAVSLIKLLPNGDIDTTFNAETNTSGIQWLSASNSLSDSVAVDNTTGDIYAGMTTSSNAFGGMIAFTSGGTIEQKFYGKDLQRLTLTTNATTFSAGTPYVIEDFNIYISRTQVAGSPQNYTGLYAIKGIKISDFVTGTTSISASALGYYGIQARISYWLPSSVGASGINNQYSLELDDKIDWNSQYCYGLNYNNLTIYVYDVRQLYRLTSSSPFVFPTGVFLYGTSNGFDSSLNSATKPVIVSTQGGSGANVKSLYYTRGNVIRQLPLSNIRSGIDPLSLVGSQTMSEVPPGNTTTYPVSSIMFDMTFVPEIDRFVITTVAAPFKSYITNFNSSFVTPTLTSTVWSRDVYNSLSYQNSFERTFLVDGRQLQGPLSDTRTPKYPDPQATGLQVYSKNGWLHMVRPSNSTENIIYSMPLAADGEYVNLTNNVIITPKYVIPNLISITGFYMNTLKEIGSSVFSQSPEPIFVDFRTTGIDDNTGSWTTFNNIDQLNTLLCNNTTNNITIQFRFRFRVVGINCNPNRLYGFTFTYEDDTTDSHYLPSVTKSSLTNRVFAWQQTSLFNSNIPNMKVRVYNANNGNIILYDTITDSNLGAWEYSTDGTTWNPWSSSADAVGNYIRYTADYLPSNYKLRVGLNQV